MTAARQTSRQRPVKLECRALWKIFGLRGHSEAADRPISGGGRAAVRGVSFEVREGEVFVLMGLSGSGKSTTLRCLARLVEPTRGQIVVDEEDVTAMSAHELMMFRRNKIGMVFQDFGLLPHLTVLGNVIFPLKVRGVAEAARRQRAYEMLALVGLEGREDDFPDQLSGGQQQRVGIARSLAINPQLLFMDEPFSALDPLIRRQMQDEFVHLERELDKTVVFVTHDFAEAMRVGDRIAIMKDGEIVQCGTPSELVLRPASPYVAEFTREVPRLRCLTAATLTELKGREEAIPDQVVEAEASLEDLLPLFAAGAPALGVRRGSDPVELIIRRQTYFDVVAASLGESARPQRSVVRLNGQTDGAGAAETSETVAARSPLQ